MKAVLVLALGLWVALPLAGRMHAAPSSNLRLSKGRDSFFVEDNFAYRRFLRLSRDGTYRQFDQDAVATLETDQGTWQQESGGVVLLHFTCRGLRFRALHSGPLAVTLGGTEGTEALPKLAVVIQQLLADSGAGVFPRDAAIELQSPPTAVTVDGTAESFGRDELTGLLSQIKQATETERTRTYRLTPMRLPGGPLLLVLQGAVFDAARAATVSREYRVQHGKAPPFYFAQTDAAAFEERLGIYRSLESQWPTVVTAPGGTLQP